MKLTQVIYNRDTTNVMYYTILCNILRTNKSQKVARIKNKKISKKIK